MEYIKEKGVVYDNCKKCIKPDSVVFQTTEYQN